MRMFGLCVVAHLSFATIVRSDTQLLLTRATTTYLRTYRRSSLQLDHQEELGHADQTVTRNGSEGSEEVMITQLYYTDGA